mmetsp:Transcript_10519/g.5380  ORF Transcript_10519/g.5380 Transcript_10519/m.5380 type:complete len:95 (+) Transcript_10519:103-387(+)
MEKHDSGSATKHRKRTVEETKRSDPATRTTGRMDESLYGTVVVYTRGQQIALASGKVTTLILVGIRDCDQRARQIQIQFGFQENRACFFRRSAL